MFILCNDLGNKLTLIGFLGIILLALTVVRRCPTMKQGTLKKPLVDGEGIYGDYMVRHTL